MIKGMGMELNIILLVTSIKENFSMIENMEKVFILPNLVITTKDGLKEIKKMDMELKQ
jgi:hypothetical protein